MNLRPNQGRKAISPRLRPIDWFAMIGMPILCAAVLFFGLRAVIGPIPKVSPVQRIKEGAVDPGETVDKVLKDLGNPKEIHSNPDGTTDLVYTRTVADPEIAVEVATVHLTAGGEVSSTTIERQTPTVAEDR